MCLHTYYSCCGKYLGINECVFPWTEHCIDKIHIITDLCFTCYIEKNESKINYE